MIVTFISSVPSCFYSDKQYKKRHALSLVSKISPRLISCQQTRSRLFFPFPYKYITSPTASAYAFCYFYILLKNKMILNKVFGLLAIAVSAIHGADYYNPDIQADIEAAIVSSVIYAPVPTPRMLIAAEPPEYTASNDAKTVCHNYRTDFKSNLRGWQVENTMQDTYDINEVGVQLNLLPPHVYYRTFDKISKLPYKYIRSLSFIFFFF